MSFLSDFEKEAGIVETDVVNFFATTLPNFEHKVESEIQTAATWFDTKALPWMAAHGQEISQDIVGVIGVAGTIAAAAGTGLPVPVMAAAAAFNTANSLVQQALAAQQQSASQGGSAVQQTIQAGLAAYQGLKTAQKATASALSVAAGPVVTAAPVTAS
jgi:hypothetical protein